MAAFVADHSPQAYERLVDRYLDSLEREPVLIVPNRSDVDFVERELLGRRPALLAGTIGTFDDVFERIAQAGGEGRRALPRVQRAFVVRRAIAAVALNGLSESAQSGGFADALADSIAEAAPVPPVANPEAPAEHSPA